MPDTISEEKLLEALEQSIPIPDSVYLLKEGWAEHNGRYTIQGAVLSREQAQKWVDERPGTMKRDGYSQGMGFGVHPYRRYERVQVFY
ncbi:hypothetical protein LCGC14_2048370 [marine sediment metagenome]|uniref:Uncharacterized protein n=1 Tax=marine sediment metagenome TaxID=412755 RepID=A0A0F9HLQ0_9ZZZZ